MDSDKILSLLPSAYLVTDATMKIIFSNEELRRLVNYNINESANFEELLNPASKIFLQTHILPILKRDKEVREIFLKFKDTVGHEVPVLINAVSCDSDEESLVFWSVFETKERQKFERELIDARNKLEDKAKELLKVSNDLSEEVAVKNKLFSIIAHDLRSPFNAILGFSEILSSDTAGLSKSSVSEYAANIHKSAKETYSLLNNLLEWSEMQLRGLNANPESFCLKEAVSSVTQLLANQSISKNIKIISPSEGAYVFADRNMTELVIRNLLSNALKFSPQNSQIEITIEKHKGDAQCSVRDFGMGIDPSQVNALFKLDSKTSTKGTDGEQGTGLGLPLCRQLVELNGGDISCVSKKGAGSVFSFTTPLG